MKGKNLVIIDKDITENTVWKKCNRYIISADVNVKPNVLLKIQDGTCVSILNSSENTNQLNFESGSRLCAETVYFSSVDKTSDGIYCLSTNISLNGGLNFYGSNDIGDYTGSDEKKIELHNKLKSLEKNTGAEYKIKKLVVSYLGTNSNYAQVNFYNVLESEIKIDEIVFNNDKNTQQNNSLLNLENSSLKLQKLSGVDFGSTLIGGYSGKLTVCNNLTFIGYQLTNISFEVKKGCEIDVNAASSAISYVFPYQEFPNFNNQPFITKTTAKNNLLFIYNEEE